MDQELKAYLEEMEARLGERFARLEGRMDERFSQVDGRFAQVDERFSQVDGRLAQVDERFIRMDERFERVETEGRHTRVLLEGMHDNIRLLAEGVMGLTERMEAHQAETARGFQEVKEMLSPYYRNLGGRAKTLEDDMQSLDRRVRVLEGRGDRQAGEVLDAIQKKFGKSQS